MGAEAEEDKDHATAAAKKSPTRRPTSQFHLPAYERKANSQTSEHKGTNSGDRSELPQLKLYP